jgi:hypothetical protein
MAKTHQLGSSSHVNKKGPTKCTLCGIVLFKLNTFFVMFLRVPCIDSTCFFVYVGFIGDHFFLLSTDSTYLRVPGDKGGSILFRLRFFFGTRFMYKLVYYNLYHLSNFMQNHPIFNSLSAMDGHDRPLKN